MVDQCACVQAFTLPKRALASLLGVLSSYLRAQVDFDSCFYLDHDADEPVQELEDGVKVNMHLLKGAGLDELADGVSYLFCLSLSHSVSLSVSFLSRFWVLFVFEVCVQIRDVDI